MKTLAIYIGGGVVSVILLLFLVKRWRRTHSYGDRSGEDEMIKKLMSVMATESTISPEKINKEGKVGEEKGVLEGQAVVAAGNKEKVKPGPANDELKGEETVTLPGAVPAAVPAAAHVDIHSVDEPSKPSRTRNEWEGHEQVCFFFPCAPFAFSCLLCLV